MSRQMVADTAVRASCRCPRVSGVIFPTLTGSIVIGGDRQRAEMGSESGGTLLSNLGRALRRALRFRRMVAGIFASSILVAVFWGANFGMVYPMLGVVLKQRSLQTWVDAEIATATERVTELQSQLDALPQDGEGHRRETLLARQQAEQQALQTGQWLQPWIHRYLPDRPFPTLVWIVVGLLVGTLLKTAFLVTNTVLVESLSQRVTLELRQWMYRRTLALPLSEFGHNRTSTLLSRFTHDMDAVTHGLQTALGRAVREPLKIVACLLGAGFVCWRLLLFCLVATPVAIYLINRLARSIKRANRRAMDGMAHVYGHLSETLDGMETVKAYTMERHERRAMHLRCKEYFQRAMRIAWYQAMAKPFTEVMSIGVVCLGIVAGGYLVLHEQTHVLGLKMSNRPLTFEALMTFFVMLAGVSDPFRKLAEVYNQLQRGAAAADRIFGFIDAPPGDPDARPATLPAPTPSTKLTPSSSALPPFETLTLHDVRFSYDGHTPVLQSVNLRIAAGQRVAILGANGCGKSTLVKLIPRFYEPNRGHVDWNGEDLRDFPREEIRRRIGWVSQQTQLFDDSVRANIRYGSPHATDFEILEAARRAHADQFIHQLPLGLDASVGQGGRKLSGGQRQRIALARAILRDPEILILDEATSQIDAESERLIHEALQSFLRGRTAIMITHRASTLALADHIVVMDSGTIVDQGSHSQLVRRCPTYQRLTLPDPQAMADADGVTDAKTSTAQAVPA